MPELTDLEVKRKVAVIAGPDDLSPVAKDLVSYVGDFNNIPELRRTLHLDYQSGNNLSDLVKTGELDAEAAINMLAAELIVMEEALELMTGVRIFVETTALNADYANQLTMYENAVPSQRIHIKMYTEQFLEILRL